MKTHFGDPCLHCGTPHDEVSAGPCTGTEPPIVASYAIMRQAWQNPVSSCDTVRCFMSDGTIREEHHHPSEHWPYSERFRNAKATAPEETP